MIDRIMQYACKLLNPNEEDAFSERRRESMYILAGILLFGLLLRILGWFLEPTVSRDGILYLNLIQVWHEGDSFEAVMHYWKQFWIPPFPLYLMKIIMGLGFSAEVAGVGLNVILGSSLPAIMYGIAIMTCNNRWIAIASALLCAVNPSLIDLSIEPQRDTIYLFFCGLLIYALLSGIRCGKWCCWSAAGIFFSVSYLTRYETLEFIPILSMCFVLLMLFQRDAWKKHLLNGGIFVFSALITLLLLVFLMGVEEHLYAIYLKYYQRIWLFITRIY